MSPEPGGIFFELKRRNVFKVGVLYVVIAWLLLQAADIILPALDTAGCFCVSAVATGVE